MQKAHLYEAIHLVNRGIDDAIRGLERLKRAKVPSLKGAYFDEKLTLFETHRALLNGYFCNNMDSSEQAGSRISSVPFHIVKSRKDRPGDLQ